MDGAGWRARQARVRELTARLEDGITAAEQHDIARQLNEARGDEKWEVRQAVARGAARLDHPLANTILAALLDDSNSYVQREAEGALRERNQRREALARFEDQVDRIDDELERLRQSHGDGVAGTARRVADRQFELLMGETIHELRTVVTGLRSALARIDGGAHGRPLEIARERATYLDRMLDDARNFVRHVALENEIVTLGEIARESLDWVREQEIDGRKHPDAVRIADDFPAQLRVDVPRLRLVQAVSSLLKNAVEACELDDTAASVVELSATVVDATASPHDAPRWVDLRISDQGMGMGPEDLRRALLPLKSTKHDGRHTGLGLPLARKIIERECGGRLIVDSEIDVGTTVCCRLPLSHRS